MGDGRDNRKIMLRHRYGVTPADVVVMLAAQGGRCPICLVELMETSKTCVDHDRACCPGRRSCGRCIRGLLCHSCNLGLGLMRDDSASLARAIQYLTKGARK